MKKEAEIRICDNCEKRVQQEDLQFGGSPFSGWFRLERTVFCGHLCNGYPDPQAGPWDFCCLKCLQEHIAALVKADEERRIESEKAAEDTAERSRRIQEALGHLDDREDDDDE